MAQGLRNGAGADAFTNHTLTNDIRKRAIGKGQCTWMGNERGGGVDDRYAYRLGQSSYLLIINASRIEPDVAWLEKQLAAFARKSEVKLVNVSDAMSTVAVQGPLVAQFIDTAMIRVAIGGTLASAATDLLTNPVDRVTFGDQTN